MDKLLHRLMLAAVSVATNLAVCLAALAAPSETMIIHAGALLTRHDAPVLTTMSVIIRDGIIIDLQPGFQNTYNGEKAALTDLSHAFVMPGLIDCHTHLTQTPHMFAGGRLAAEVSVSESDRALLGAIQARATLHAGFTTVRNVGGFRGGDGEAIFALRDAINRGLIEGPRIFAAGQAISIVGGHADTHDMKQPVADALLSPGICTGADQCAYAARALIKRGADWIKITATGGVTDTANSGLGQHFTDAELVAIVEASHLMGRKVAAHAHSAEGIKAALRAGVDTIEHGTFADDEAIKLFKRHDAFFVTTITAPTWLYERTQMPGATMPPVIQRKLEEAMRSLDEATLRAIKSGVNVALGTDAGVSPHGQNAQELIHLVRIGATEREAIKAATTSAAELLGLEAEIGAVEIGRRADIIGVCGDPLTDISQLTAIVGVIKDGALVKHADCPTT